VVCTAKGEIPSFAAVAPKNGIHELRERLSGPVEKESEVVGCYERKHFAIRWYNCHFMSFGGNRHLRLSAVKDKRECVTGFGRCLPDLSAAQ
jgi:hypothetical protein